MVVVKQVTTKQSAQMKKKARIKNQVGKIKRNHLAEEPSKRRYQTRKTKEHTLLGKTMLPVPQKM